MLATQQQRWLWWLTALSTNDSRYAHPTVLSPEGHKLIAVNHNMMHGQGLRMTKHQRAWEEVQVPEGLGRDCITYKWYQNQSYTHLHALLPETVPAKQVLPESKRCLTITPDEPHSI